MDMDKIKLLSLNANARSFTFEAVSLELYFLIDIIPVIICLSTHFWTSEPSVPTHP